MKHYTREEIEKIHGIVWKCLEAPLEENGLPWANQNFNIPVRYPIRVSADALGKVSVEINTENLASDPNVAWAALTGMESSLREKFGPIETKFVYGFRYLIFQFNEE